MIKIPRTKWTDRKWQNISVVAVAIPNRSILMPYCHMWQLQTSACQEAPKQQRCHKTNKKRQPINTCERHTRIHASFISISVKMGGTSSSIPRRLNNSSWSTSFLHIKKRLHAAWVFVWAVERKTAVSCQGERSEIISIIYGCDVQKRRMQGGEEAGTWETQTEGVLSDREHRQNCV